MSQHSNIQNLEDLLALLHRLGENHEEITLGTALTAVGTRSFGPLLALVGFIPMSPLSGVPSVPTFSALILLVIIVQLLLGQRHFWLPRWILRRKISQAKFQTAINSLQKPAVFIDRFISPRLSVLTSGIAVYLVASI